MTMNLTDALPNWSELTKTQRLLILRQEKVRRVSTRRFDLFYPETGPLRRSLYPEHPRSQRAQAQSLIATPVGRMELHPAIATPQRASDCTGPTGIVGGRSPEAA